MESCHGFTLSTSLLHEKKMKDKVIIMFQNEVSSGGLGIPVSYLEIKVAEVERLIQWLQTNAEQMQLS
jgi:hypothetical protein